MHVFERQFCRACTNRRARTRPIRSITARRSWWAERAREIYAHIPISAASSSKRIRKTVRGRLRTGAVMPRALTCWPSVEAVRRHRHLALLRLQLQAGLAGSLRRTERGPHTTISSRWTGSSRQCHAADQKRTDGFPSEGTGIPAVRRIQKTNQLLEFQITQEYTGQQSHLCYFVPQWKEVLDFDTYARGRIQK